MRGEYQFPGGRPMIEPMRSMPSPQPTRIDRMWAGA